MGHKYQIDFNSIARQINLAKYECGSPYNDGFVGWGYKQDLYRLKWILDKAIRDCPSFAGEQEWLREHEQKKIIDYLKNDIQQN